jgi:hypothetical protein
MKKVRILTLPVALAFATLAFATNVFADSTPAKPAPAPDARKIPRSVERGRTGFFILRQDLFDRNNPNNLRSDYHGPPAQPGSY